MVLRCTAWCGAGMTWHTPIAGMGMGMGIAWAWAFAFAFACAFAFAFACAFAFAWGWHFAVRRGVAWRDIRMAWCGIEGRG